MNDNEVTILMACALMADTWGTCVIAATRVVLLAKFILIKPKTEPNMSEYWPTTCFCLVDMYPGNEVLA